MTSNRQAHARKHKLAAVACATLGLLATMPAFSADAEVEALKQELAAQRKLIEQLLANQKQGGGSPTSAQEVDQRLREGGKQPIAAPEPATNVPSEGNMQFRFYGIADVSLSDSNSGYGNKVRVDGGGGMAASRLGAQVTRTFGDNYKATAVVEGGMQFGTGSVGAPAPTLGLNDTTNSSGGSTGTGPVIFARQAWAGLDAGFGQISIGRQYTASYIGAAAIGSVFGDGLYGITGSFTPVVGGLASRMNNSIAWATPKFGGFYGQFTYTSGANNNVSSNTAVGTTMTNSKAGRGADLGLLYTDNRMRAALTTWDINANSWVTAGETGLAKKKGIQLSANYDFGWVKVAGDLLHGTILGGNYQNVTKTLSNSTGYGVSAQAPIAGKHHFMVSYTVVNDNSALNKDGKLYALAYWYDLYTKTTLYVSAGKMQNNANSTYTLNDGGNIVGNDARPGYSPRAIEGGLNYRF